MSTQFQRNDRDVVVRWLDSFRRVAELGLFICAIALAGCSADSAQDTDRQGKEAVSAMSPEQCMANAEIQQTALADPNSYVIQPGDDLSVDFYLNPEFNDQVAVRPDGKVTLRMVGDLKAAGLTSAQFANVIDKAYTNELRSPDAVVHVKNMPSRQVYVQGQVSKPGAFPLETGMTALQAISEAGGLTEDANSSAVVIRRDACGTPHPIRINLASASAHPDKGEDIALTSRDILVVPRSTISSMDLFVKKYIRDLLPVQPYATMPMM
jgi:polysaccharide biosynthesis/export protein